jgi:hypothetical protein
MEGYKEISRLTRNLTLMNLKGSYYQLFLYHNKLKFRGEVGCPVIIGLVKE